MRRSLCTDKASTTNEAMFQMMGVSAEFERAIIQERVRAGLARAKSEGKRLGRGASGRLWRLLEGQARSLMQFDSSSPERA